MKNTILQIRFRRSLANQKGIGALVLVMLALVIIAAIVFSFVAQQETKQLGGAMLSSSVNAFATAEAGIRHAEKCLQQNDANCPAVTANTDWTNLTTGYTKTFGDGDGNFTITFTIIDANTTTINSVGTYRDSSREMSKTIAQVGGCKLITNVLTTCNAPSIAGGVTLTGTQESGYCPGVLVAPPTFPGGAYPNFKNGLPAIPYQYGKYEHTNGSTITLNGPLTLWVSNFFKMSGSSRLVINGDVTINVDGKVDLLNTANIEVNGTLTFQAASNFKMSDLSVINTTSGDPADVVILGEGPVTLDNDAILNGAIISNGMVTIKRDAVLTGSILSDDATLSNNAIVTHDATAGENTTGYAECTP